MRKQEKPSEILQEFIDFLEESRSMYEYAKKKCEEFDSLDRHIYWAHRIEFAKDKNERNRIATAHQKERLDRRRYKDICDMYEKIHLFVCSENNKATLKRMKGVVSAQKRQEEYLESERHYNGKIQEGEKNES